MCGGVPGVASHIPRRPVACERGGVCGHLHRSAVVQLVPVNHPPPLDLILAGGVTLWQRFFFGYGKMGGAYMCIARSFREVSDGLPVVF